MMYVTTKKKTHQNLESDKEPQNWPKNHAISNGTSKVTPCRKNGNNH